MQRIRIILFNLIFLSLSIICSTQSYAGTILVSNVLANSVSLIDETTLIPINEVKVGYMPHEVAISTDGKTALVANFGDILGVIPGESISVIDIANARVANTINLPKKSRPHGLAFISDSKALVTAQGIQSLLMLDLGSAKVVQSLKLPGAGAHMVVVDNAKQYAYVANTDSGTVCKIDLRTFSVVATTRIGNEAEGMSLTPQNDLLYVANRKDNNIAVLRTKDLEIQKKITTANGPARVVMFNDGQSAVVANTVSGNAQIIDTNSLTLTKTFNTTSSSNVLPVPINFAVRNDQKTAYVTNFFANNVTLVDLIKGEVIKTFKAGYMPDGVAISPIKAMNNDHAATVTFAAKTVEINANIESVWQIAKNLNDYYRISHGAITAHVVGDVEPGKTITLELYKDRWFGHLIPSSTETITMVDDEQKILAWSRRLPGGEYTQRYQILEKIGDNKTRSSIVLRIPDPIGSATKYTLGDIIENALTDLNEGIKAEAEK